MDGRRLGSLIGVIGGLAFVLGNLGATGLPAGATWVVVALAAGLVSLVVVAATRDDTPPPPPPSRRSLRTYGVAVVAMLVAIPLGSVLLGAGGLPELRRCWVVMVVGAHFLPFTRAFGTRLFLGLALALVTVGVVGAAVAVSGVDAAPALCAVTAGLILLVFAWLGLARGAGSRAATRT